MTVLCDCRSIPDSPMNSLPPDPLDPLLDRWSETPPPPDRLAATVWERIATRQPAKPLGWRALLESWFERPALAVGFVTACALLGLLVAEVQVSRLQRERGAQLVKSYLLLIDPLLSESKQGPQP